MLGFDWFKHPVTQPHKPNGYSYRMYSTQAVVVADRTTGPESFFPWEIYKYGSMTSQHYVMHYDVMALERTKQARKRRKGT